MCPYCTWNRYFFSRTRKKVSQKKASWDACMYLNTLHIISLWFPSDMGFCYEFYKREYLLGFVIWGQKECSRWEENSVDVCVCVRISVYDTHIFILSWNKKGPLRVLICRPETQKSRPHSACCFCLGRGARNTLFKAGALGFALNTSRNLEWMSSSDKTTRKLKTTATTTP